MSSKVGGRFRGVALVAVVPVILMGGCATQPQYPQANWYAGGPRPVATAEPRPAPPVEMEDDGRPAQIPPRAEARGLPDDPREPWSRNYGGPAIPAGQTSGQPPRQQAAAGMGAAAVKPAMPAQQVAWTHEPQ